MGLAEEITIKRPNKIIVTAYLADGPVKAISDGKYLYTLDVKANKYTKQKLEKGDSGIAEAILSTGAPTLETAFLLENSSVHLNHIRSLQLGKRRVLFGTEVTDVIMTLDQMGNIPMKATVTYSIGTKNHLLYQSEITASQGRQSRSVIENWVKVEPDPALPDSLFTFSPPAGSHLVTSLGDPIYDERFKPGMQPAALRATDLTGKSITLDAYKGKVVLLDFWATWCAPCREEIPKILSLYRKYHQKGLEVIGISLDGASGRGQILDYIKEQRIPWRQVFDGKGFDSPLATAYKLQAIPFTLLIGRDGKVATVDPSDEELGTAILHALKP